LYEQLFLLIKLKSLHLIFVTQYNYRHKKQNIKKLI